MQYLGVPATDAEDDAVVDALCLDPEWSHHRNDWLQAYASYRASGGNPWSVVQGNFTEEVRLRMYHLYTSRRKTAALTKMRDSQLPSCPMCGSLTTGSLDHHLPREAFQEFSILRVNLVPACSHCNSSSKGNTFKGDEAERFIHPYYDEWASEPLWQVEIKPPFAAATFAATAVPGLGEEQTSLVRFHLKHVLGKQFFRSMITLWSTYPESLMEALTAYDLASVTHGVSVDRNRAARSQGVNSWNAAFFRGLLANPDAIDHIRTRINEAVEALAEG